MSVGRKLAVAFGVVLAAIAVIDKIARGDVYKRLLTFREGLTIRQLALRVAAGRGHHIVLGTAADIAVTPRPIYKANGGKIFDIASYPQRFKTLLKRDLGEFPFPAFWGPAAGIASSEWIARSAEWIEEKHRPDLSLVYLPLKGVAQNIIYPFLDVVWHIGISIEKVIDGIETQSPMVIHPRETVAIFCVREAVFLFLGNGGDVPIAYRFYVVG